jgi:hypothetical protein
MVESLSIGCGGGTSAGTAEAAAATTTTRRRRSGALTLRASAGHTGSTSMALPHRRPSTNGRLEPTTAVASPHLHRWLPGAPITTRAHPARPRRRLHRPRACLARACRSTRPRRRRVPRAGGLARRITSPMRPSPASSSRSRRAAAGRPKRRPNGSGRQSYMSSCLTPSPPTMTSRMPSPSSPPPGMVV